MSAFKVERSVDQKTAEDGNGSEAEVRWPEQQSFDRPTTRGGAGHVAYVRSSPHTGH